MTDWRLKDTIDAILLRIISGLRAITFQNYTEVNVKTGAQRVASAILTVNAGAVLEELQQELRGSYGENT